LKGLIVFAVLACRRNDGHISFMEAAQAAKATPIHRYRTTKVFLAVFIGQCVSRRPDIEAEGFPHVHHPASARALPQPDGTVYAGEVGWVKR